MVPATVNEMLMQSFEGIIRLFPCWDKNSDASFENLRADGAFLVSASLEKGKISGIKIKSLKGRPCIMELDGVKSVIKESDKTEIPFKKNGNTISFDTEENTTYIFKS